MAHVPEDARWYWAEVIEEISVERDDQNVVHRNIVLIRADSPTEAYEKAIDIGKQYEASYQNPAGESVHARFRGLGGLDVIHDGLEHGAELMYQEDIAVSPEQIQKWICPKERLALFRAEKDSVRRPDYRSKEIVDEARKLIERQR